MYLTLILFYYLSSILSFEYAVNLFQFLIQLFSILLLLLLHFEFILSLPYICLPVRFLTPLIFSIFFSYFFNLRFFIFSFSFLFSFVFLFYIFLLLLFCASGGLARFYSATIIAPIEMIKTIKTGKGRYIQ